jgi:hypothetical protein
MERHVSIAAAATAGMTNSTKLGDRLDLAYPFNLVSSGSEKS